MVSSCGGHGQFYPGKKTFSYEIATSEFAAGSVAIKSFFCISTFLKRQFFLISPHLQFRQRNFSVRIEKFELEIQNRFEYRSADSTRTVYKWKNVVGSMNECYLKDSSIRLCLLCCSVNYRVLMKPSGGSRFCDILCAFNVNLIGPALSRRKMSSLNILSNDLLVRYCNICSIIWRVKFRFFMFINN